MNTTNDRIIIGIDPGTNVMGYGVLRIIGNTPELMTLGVIQLNKFESHYLRLRRIFERVLGLIEQYLPDEMAIEAPFFGKNVQSMLKLGRAQNNRELSFYRTTDDRHLLTSIFFQTNIRPIQRRAPLAF